MKNLYLLKITILLCTILISNGAVAQVFITELADPNDNAGARYVELYNEGTTAIDLSNWSLRRWTNDNVNPQNDVALSGSIASKGFVVFVANSASFDTAFPSFSGTRIQLGTGGPVDSNGDDNIALINDTGTLVDMFGIVGEDGTGTCHEFEDGRAERKATVLTAKATWNEADWNVWADSAVAGCTSHTNTPQNVADGFDPGLWIGAAATPGITIGAVSNNTTEDGTTATFTVVLQKQPATDVVLNVTSEDTGEVTLDQATLTYTNGNWNIPQTVTATGVDDGLADGNIAVTITISVDDALSDDDYDAVADASTVITNEDNEPDLLLINEILADPSATTGDANGDGTVDISDDEFVEIYNNSGGPLDISGYRVHDGIGLRHSFPQGTVIPTAGTIVVFGGGNPSTFTGVGGLVQVASTGSLSLNNGGDDLIIYNASDNVVTSVNYATASNDQSIARNPDFTGAFVDHSTIGSNTVDFSPGKGNSDNTPFIKTWSGTTNTDWATAANWVENSTPGTTDNVIVRKGASNYPTASGVVTLNSMIIESGATFVSASTFTGSATFKRTLANGSQWYLMTSPVVGETFDDTWVSGNSVDTGQGSNRGISWYDNDTNNPTTGHWRYLQATDNGTFNVGQGYAIRLSTSETVSFSGTGLYTSTQTFGITQGTANNFNLVGNPFTGFLNLGEFFRDNGAGVIAGATAWFWDNTTGQYNARTLGVHPSFEIAPGQGFFVEAAASTNLTFDIADVSHQSSETFQKNQTRPEIRLFLSDDVHVRNANIYYINGTTASFDLGYEGKLFGGKNYNLAVFTQLVSNDQGVKYQIQSLPNAEHEKMVVPVGIIADAGKEITFTIEAINLPAGLKVFLEDRQTNSFTRLDEANAKYTVTLDHALNDIGRFYLHTATSVLSTSEATLQNVSLYPVNSNTLRVVGLSQVKANVKVFNILGKQVLDRNFSSNGTSDIALPKLSTGVYIVQLTSEKGKLNKKIIIE